MIRRPGAGPVAVASLLLFAGCGAEAAGPPPTRVRLFDLMDQARIEDMPGRGGNAATAVVHGFDFDAVAPERLWLGRADGRSVDWGEEIGEVDADGGRGGAGLRLGPGVPEDRSRAVFVVPIPPLAHVRVTGRVKLENNPRSEDSSSREVLQLSEHDRVVDDPTRVRSRSRWSSSRNDMRVSRLIDPSGWDRIDVDFISRSATQSLEVRLLHRSGDADDAVTRFDDITIEAVPLSDGEIYQQVAARYVPNDGNAALTPWRLRVELGERGGGEVRDAFLLPPPAKIAFPVHLPGVEVAPVLRFQYGMAPDAHGMAGDGARIVVQFHPEGGETVAIGAVEFDPKNERNDRVWLSARFELSAVAGQAGWLEFASADVEGEGPDPLDAVLIATPRIEPATQAPQGPNILLIGIDTLRADHMHAFGYERPNTPHLSKLADEAVRFANTRSQAPWTLPSFASITTSLYPSRHGAGRGGHDEWTPIDPSTTSLAEVLSRVGYETQGIVANGLISPLYGIDQGFDGYRCAWAMESVQRDTESVADFVDGHRTTPWLLFWHIMDPHLPYQTAEKFREQFTDKDYDGRFAGGGTFSRNRDPQVPFQVLDPRPGRRWYVHEGPPPPPDLSDADRKFVHDYYDAEIAEVDDAIGRVLDAVRASGQWDRTIIALVADHGEGLGDHGHYHHGYTLFDDQVHIPMLVRIPGAHAGVVIERPVAAIDLAPTLLGAVGLQPPASFQGVDRLAADAPHDDAYFIEYPTYDSSAQKAWVLDGFKYLHDPLFHTEALYQFSADKGEKTDVAAAHPEIVARARREMDAFRWREQQSGRFHLRVRGATGQKLVVKITTDDLFGANFVTRPMRPERHITMDLDRKDFRLETDLPTDDGLELVFWCRGNDLDFAVSLDDASCPLDIGAQGTGRATPVQIARDDIPTMTGSELAWPARGAATLWLESGVTKVEPVVLTPEEIERLRELGYTK